MRFLVCITGSRKSWHEVPLGDVHEDWDMFRFRFLKLNFRSGLIEDWMNFAVTVRDDANEEVSESHLFCRGVDWRRRSCAKLFHIDGDVSQATYCVDDLSAIRLKV